MSESSTSWEETTLWVIAPVFHDVPSFLLLRERVLAELAKSKDSPWSGTDVNFVIVDDSGGTDHEIRQVDDFKDVTVLSPPFNLGHQRAIVYGLRMIAASVADEDLIVTMDSDGEDRPEDMPALLGALFGENTKPGIRQISLARRTKRKESPSFRVSYALFKMFFWFLTGTIVRTGNYAAFRGWTARHVLFHPNFDLCYSSALLTIGLETHFVPCPRGTRYHGVSKMNLVSLLMHGIRMLMPFIDRIAIRALMGFFCVLAASVVTGALAVGFHFFAGIDVPDWAINLTIALVVLSFVALGNFVVLFTIFSQSRGLSLIRLEGTDFRDALRDSQDTLSTPHQPAKHDSGPACKE
jgi:polyisoprenyl-phosphate glycosyltransferase